MTPLRLVFLGSDPIALPLLNWLAGEGRSIAEVVAVFTQPDRASGRGQKVHPNAIKDWARDRGVPLLQPEKLSVEVREQLVGFHADLSVVMAYGHILRDEFVAAPRLGTLNLHTSLLPMYRGASPIQTAVASGDSETGVTLMRIVRKLDAGPIGDAERVPIGRLDTALEVEAKLAGASEVLLRRALPRVADGTLNFTTQDETKVSYCRKLEKSDGGLDFSVPAEVLSARINGLFPWPGCSAEIAGQPIKFGLADTVEAATIRPSEDRLAELGTVLGTDLEGLLVQTGRGVVRLRRLQRPGGKMLPAAEFLRGFPIAAGTQIPSQCMPALVRTGA